MTEELDRARCESDPRPFASPIPRSAGRGGRSDFRVSNVPRAIQVGIVVLAAAISMGCATSNYDFRALPGERGAFRAAQLAEDLQKSSAEGGDSELYDLSLFPLARLDLNVFARIDNDGSPPGYVEADVNSYLPIFCIVDASIDRYSEDHSLYEHHDLDSYFWGLFQFHREEIATPFGMRRERQFRFLWFLGWTGKPVYIEELDLAAESKAS